jgi:predicted DNA-binding protein (MmcQ/YjbR family)
MPRTKKTGPHDTLLRSLRAFGLAYPETQTKSPWPGHFDLAVRDKTFAYLSLEGEPLHISCKLPHSHALALELPNAKPTPYGLGKSGWVSLSFEAHDRPDEAMLRAWIDESYRAQAPKKLVAQIGAGDGATKPQSSARARSRRASSR